MITTLTTLLNELTTSKLNTLESFDFDFKTQIEINELSLFQPVTESLVSKKPILNEFEQTLINTNDIDKLHSYITHNSAMITDSSLMISILSDDQHKFDICMSVITERFAIALLKYKKMINNGKFHTFNSIYDNFNIPGINLSDIIICCALSSNMYYVKTINNAILKHMGESMCTLNYWLLTSMAAKNDNVDILEYLETENILTTHLMVRGVYCAIMEDKLDVLSWLLFEKERTIDLPVLDCFLDACIYLNRCDEFLKTGYPAEWDGVHVLATK